MIAVYKYSLYLLFVSLDKHPSVPLLADICRCYMILAAFDKRGTGYNDEHIKIKSLFFADDALLLSHSLEEAKENLDIITDVSRDFGPEINIEKSNVMIFNLEDQPEYLGNIKVVPKVKYLGIKIDNKRNYFKTQRQNFTKSPENGKHNI